MTSRFRCDVKAANPEATSHSIAATESRHLTTPVEQGNIGDLDRQRAMVKLWQKERTKPHLDLTIKARTDEKAKVFKGVLTSANSTS